MYFVFVTWNVKENDQILTTTKKFQSKHKNMTFVWTEMAFLSLWWETAHQVSVTKDKFCFNNKTYLKDFEVNLFKNTWN